ncbi:hypothetical protein NHX12_009111, partial [Muraenolepis orangiensis]
SGNTACQQALWSCLEEETHAHSEKKTGSEVSQVFKDHTLSESEKVNRVSNQTEGRGSRGTDFPSDGILSPPPPPSDQVLRRLLKEWVLGAGCRSQVAEIKWFGEPSVWRPRASW